MENPALVWDCSSAKISLKNTAGKYGLKSTRQIRLFNKEMIIIAQTAYAQEGAREKAIAAGCNDYITKPIKKDELLALIQMHFKK
jgi:CheY-like chemotaxis protein